MSEPAAIVPRMSTAAAPETVIAVTISPGESTANLVRIVPDLQTLQSLVGGFIEPVTLSHDATLWLNEEGKIYGLAVNETATALVTHARIGLQPDDYIVGTCVITGSTGSDESDVPLSVFEILQDAGITLIDDLDAPPTGASNPAPEATAATGHPEPPQPMSMDAIKEAWATVPEPEAPDGGPVSDEILYEDDHEADT